MSLAGYVGSLFPRILRITYKLVFNRHTLYFKRFCEECGGVDTLYFKKTIILKVPWNFSWIQLLIRACKMKDGHILREFTTCLCTENYFISFFCSIRMDVNTSIATEGHITLKDGNR